MSESEILWNRVLVDPNPQPGGEPIRVGITHRWTSQPGRDGVKEIFAAPVPDGEMPPSLTPAQIHQVNECDDAAGQGQFVQVHRRPDGTGEIVLHEPGAPDRVLADLVRDV